MKRLVVGATGSTGSIYGIRLLEELRRNTEIETHLIISAAAKRTLVEETDLTLRDVEALAHVVYDDRDIGAAVASGSFRTVGMVIVPCSVKTVGALASGYADTLIARAADVTLKEGRPLIVVVRETPLHLGHLRQLVALAEIGAVIPCRRCQPSTFAQRRWRTSLTTPWLASWTDSSCRRAWFPNGKARGGGEGRKRQMCQNPGWQMPSLP